MNSELILKKENDKLILVSFPDNMLKILNSILNIVTHIGPKAFENSSIKKIVVPNNVRHISAGAFYGCKNLESVKLNANIEEIPSECFAFCSNLKEINLGDIKSIGEKAFYYCSSLESIKFSEKLQSIGSWVFLLTKVKKIKVPKEAEIQTIGIPDFEIVRIDYSKQNAMKNKIEQLFPGVTLNEKTLEKLLSEMANNTDKPLVIE